MKPLLYISGAALCLILFGSGMLVGREFPSHRYEKISTGPYLLDVSTGRVCFVFLDWSVDPTSETLKAYSTPHTDNLIDNYLSKKAAASVPDCPK